MAITGNIGGVAPDVIQRYILNADDYKAEIKDVAKEVRKQERAERDLKKVMEAVAKAEKKTAKETAGLTKQTTRNTAATNKNTRALTRQAKASKRSQKAMTMMKGAAVGLAAGGIALATKALIDNIKEADNFVQASKIYTGNLNAARQATQGLARDVDIMVAKNRLMTLGVRMSDAEFNSMLANLTKISGAMSIDMKFALESATTMLARQSTAVADNVGVVIKAEEAYQKYAASIGKTSNELTASEKKIAFQQEALEQLTKKAGELDDRAETAGAEMTKLGNAISNAASMAFATISKWKPLIDIVKGLGTALRQAVRDMGMITTGQVKTPELRANITRRMNEAMRDLRQMGIDPLTGRRVRGTGNVPTVTKARIKQLLAIVKIEQKRLDILTERSALLRRQVAFFRGEVPGIEPTVPRAQVRTVRERIVEPDRPRRRRRRPRQLGALDFLGGALGGGFGGFGAGAALGAAQEIGQPTITGPEAFTFDIGAAGLQKYAGASDAAVKADLARADALAVANKAQQDAIGFIGSTGVSTMAEFAGGLWAAADAAIQGGESMGMAVAKMVKATLLGLAQEATVKSVFYAAEAIAAAASFNYASAAKYATAAAIMGTVAAGAGTTGLLLSSATAGGSSARRKSATASNDNARTPFRPGFGRTVESTRPIHLAVYVNDPTNPSQLVITDAQIQRAANAA